MQRKRFFFDMDGTTARFYDDPDCLEKFRDKGFFRNLAPYGAMIGALKRLRQRDDVFVYILSAVADEAGEAEKRDWIIDQMSGEFQSTGPVGCFFCRVGESKADHIREFYGELTEDDILLDDYSVNLEDWVNNGGSGVKVLNGLNGRGTHGINFRGPSVSTDWTAERIYEALCREFDLPLIQHQPQVLTIMVGLPGSGKSTTAAKMVEDDPNQVLISSDSVRKEMSKNGQKPEEIEVFQEVNRKITTWLKLGRSVVYDASNLSPRSRAHVLEAVPEDLDVIVRFWVVNTPPDICMLRNSMRIETHGASEERLEKMAERYVPPKKDEYAGTCIIVNS